MYGDQGHSDEHRRIQDILEYLNLNNNNSAEELLQSILTSTDILTWNSKGEIVYKGHDIRGTDIVDLVRYCLMPYNQDIPELAGLSLFLKGLAELEIDKSLISNGRVLIRLARKDHVPMKDFDDSETVSDCTQDSDALSDDSEYVDTICKNCNKHLHISHLGTCPVCTWTDFYRNCLGSHCMICDFRLSKGDISHVITCCSHCSCDEIMDVNTGEKRMFKNKTTEQSDYTIS